jgi:3-phosphoshikimate 1-carboxyvinyltransferase
VAALFADGTTTLRNIASWRVKETDRISAMAIELRKVGAKVEEGADFIRVTPPQVSTSKNLTPLSPPLSGGKIGSSPDKGRLEGVGFGFGLIVNPADGIDTYDDHRMAMCFSLAAFGGAGVRINDPKCVAKTFPDYFERFMSVVQKATPSRACVVGAYAPYNHGLLLAGAALPRRERELDIPVIAIDGPSASGKGTVAQRVATALGLHYLDSGALYRLLALAAQRRGVALEAEERLAELAGQVDIRFEGADIWLDGVQVGDELRTEEAGSAASKIAALPRVRAALLDKQRDFRRAPGLVADGRDMASVVFPDSVLKIFLTASAEARAERRFKQLKEKGMSANIVALLQDIQARDERDTQRSVAPLQQAQGASLLDTTSLNIEQAVQEVLTRYHALESK